MHLLAASMLSPEHLLATFGTIGLIAIIFAESGLLIGFFLPGDSLLFTAGLLASQGKLNLAAIVIGCFVAAVVGDQVGYWFGKRVGPTLFRRPDSRLFKQENVERAGEFFHHHGSKTIVLARFIPIVRTFAPILAGVSNMHYRTFVTFNVIGAALWAGGVTMAGYVLGSTIPSIDRYLLPVIALIVALSLVPVGLEARRNRAKRAAEARRSAAEGDSAARRAARARPDRSVRIVQRRSREELAEQGAALLRPYPGAHRELVVQAGIGRQVVERPQRAGLGVLRTEDHPLAPARPTARRRTSRTARG